MPSSLDLKGRRFGRLTAVERAGVDGQRHALWACNCDCGGKAVTRSTHLTGGHTVSCGCVRGLAMVHGGSGTAEYRVWLSARSRCYNPNDPDYRRYGGRGIRMCKEWDDFAAFLDHVGPRPDPSLSIDRIDNDGHYEPGNVRWATAYVQVHNRTPSR